MKTYDQLTAEQQEMAIIHATNLILTDILENKVQFNLLEEDDLQERIDQAITKADRMETPYRMETPWFAHKYIMETCKKYIMETCKKEIVSMAQSLAEDILYPNTTEFISTLHFD